MNYDRYINLRIKKKILEKFNCTISFDPLLNADTDLVCSHAQAVRAVKFYETTPLAGETLWVHKPSTNIL